MRDRAKCLEMGAEMLAKICSAAAAVSLCTLLIPPASAGPGDAIVDALHDAYASADAGAIAALYAEDAVVITDAFPIPLVGRNAISGAEATLFGAFCAPEWQATDVVRHGNKRVAIQYTLSVDFCGAFPGPDGSMLAPTGERITLELATFLELEKGLIVRERRYANVQALYDQLLPQ